MYYIYGIYTYPKNLLSNYFILLIALEMTDGGNIIDSLLFKANLQFK